MAETIRVVHRALAVLRIMNGQSVWTLQELATESGLPKTTLHRILATLEDEGYVAASHPTFYRLTGKTLDLSGAVGVSTICADLSEQIVIDMSRRFSWPLSFAVAEFPFMRVIACGMPYSVAHSARHTSAGRRHWMFTSAVGSAYLSSCSEEDVSNILRAAERFNAISAKPLPLPSMDAILEVAEKTRECGYALRLAKPSDLNSAVAVPVMAAGKLAGALACSTFPHSLSQDKLPEIVRVLLDAAAELSAGIEARDVAM